MVCGYMMEVGIGVILELFASAREGSDEAGRYCLGIELVFGKWGMGRLIADGSS